MNILNEENVFPVYKPKGYTSQQIVGKIKYLLKKELGKKKVKVGHGGTLDPLATGVLAIGLGKGCKKLQEYLKGPKTYITVAKMGFDTTTEDSEGDVVSRKSYKHINNKLIEKTLKQFEGDIEQIPPMYSALKKNGKKLYDLARQGIIVERKPRPVTIYKLKLLPKLKSMEESEFRFLVTCGGGTYVRTLIKDICLKMNTKGHMTELERTNHGVFNIKDCLIFNESLTGEKILRHLKKKTMSPKSLKKIKVKKTKVNKTKKNMN